MYLLALTGCRWHRGKILGREKRITRLELGHYRENVPANY